MQVNDLGVVSMRSGLLCVSLAALLATTACGQASSAVEARTAELDVDPGDVSEADLKAAVTDERVKRFYEARQWEPVWTEERAEALVAALMEAPRHGLSDARFRKEAAAAPSPAEREAALTFAAITYADALANGLADPKEVSSLYSVPRPKGDVVAGLAKAIEGEQMQPWIAGLAPQDEEYKALSEAFLRYSRLAKQSGTRPVPAGPTLKPGARDARVPAIAAALQAHGLMAAPEEAQGSREEAGPQAALYTPTMAAAVKQLQAEEGLEADGVVGPATLEALNAGAAERARILAINLERRRWLEREPPGTRIDVNTAATLLDYWQDGAHAHRARVVVGQPGWETPQLGSPVVRLVANPNWTVPKKIAEEEILPKGAGYMSAKNMTIRDDGYIVQQPGPDSALGLVKFDMDNPHAIYLHDTPAKALFGTDERHASHGCVRVEDAVGFARLVAGRNGRGAEFERALATGDETPVALPRPIPVRLLYHTAFLDEAGRIAFRSDAYGWDDKLAGVLGLEVGQRRGAPVHVSLPGP